MSSFLKDNEFHPKNRSFFGIKAFNCKIEALHLCPLPKEGTYPKDLLSLKGSRFAGPVVQRIVYRFPEPKMVVRFHPGSQKRKSAACWFALFSLVDVLSISAKMKTTMGEIR